MKTIILMLLGLAVSPKTPEQHFEDHATWAQIVQRFTGIPASVQLAQAFNETYFGQADTLGRDYNNVFAVMDLPLDNWHGPSGPMLGAYKRRVYTWRIYPTRLHGWLDYTQIVKQNAPVDHFGQPWTYWVENPIHYGDRNYWKKVRRTIERYGLEKYDN